MSAIPDIPVVSTCLACDSPVVLAGRVATAHLNASGQDCRGSGFVTVQNDGHDEARRKAITKTHSAEIEAARLRAELSEQLATAKVFSGWLEHYGWMITASEALATLWRATAEHGEFWQTYREVAQRLQRDPAGTDMWAQARRQAERYWISEARWELHAQAREMSPEGARTALENLLI